MYNPDLRLTCCQRTQPMLHAQISHFVSPEPKMDAKSWNGAFVCDELRLELSSNGSNIVGIIHFGNDRFALTAQLAPQGIEGHFEAAGGRYQFSAWPTDDRVIFQTEGTRYELRREAPAVLNPLRQLPAEAAPQAAPNSTLRFNKVPVIDRLNNSLAATFLLPEGWRHEAEIYWKQNPFYPVSMWLRAYDPATPDCWTVYPQQCFTDGIQQSAMQTAMIAGIEAAAFAGASMAEGGNYMGFEIRPRVQNFAQYIQHFVIPRFRQDLAQARIIDGRDMPDIGQAEAAKIGGPPMCMGIAGRLRFEYMAQGVALHEDVYCTVVFVNLGQTINWIADAKSYRARAGGLDDAMRILRTMEWSLRPDLKWYAGVAQVAQMMQSNAYASIRQAGELSRYISRVNNEVSDIIRNSYENTQRVNDRVHERFDQYIRGVDAYDSPFDRNERIEVPSGYDRAFVNPLGEVVVTNDALFEPGQHLSGDWREMRRTQ